MANETAFVVVPVEPPANRYPLEIDDLDVFKIAGTWEGGRQRNSFFRVFLWISFGLVGGGGLGGVVGAALQVAL